MKVVDKLPYFLSGSVVKGFGRGSKDLGIPTANLPDEVANSLPAFITPGIYHGWAQLKGESPRKMVASAGWNPFYNNERKSLEIHILHKYDKDFYGIDIRVLICGFIREERNYASVEDLIADINSDIAFAEEKLEKDPELAKLKNHECFQGAL